jgi:hypothetical protein
MLLMGALLAGCTGPGNGGAEASCAAPAVAVSPFLVEDGGTVRVSGRYFMDGCADTGDSPPVHPLRDLAVTLTPAGGQPREIGRVDAAGEFAMFDVPLLIPVGTAPGQATVSVGTAAPVPVTVRSASRAGTAGRADGG